MATRKEIDEYTKSIGLAPLSSGTLTRWVNKGVIHATKMLNGRYDYNLDDFIAKINSAEYQTSSKGQKQKPEDYIGRIKGNLLIKKIVPKSEYISNYSGTLMYCDCLACGNKNVQIRFTYLSDNGNYEQFTCGCGRKRRAFLASAREGIDESFLLQFSDFEKFLMVHKLLTHSTDGYYGAKCDLEEYKQAIIWLYHDKQFNKIYEFWQLHKNESSTFYDFAKPSLDHIIPLSKGGNSQISNLQILTVFENLAKRDMTMNEWNEFKLKTHTHSDYFVEEVMR